MKIVDVLQLTLLLPISLIANIGPMGFGPFLNHYFVETGTLGGQAIVKALSEGFKEARSIEYDKGNFNFVRARFANYPNVRIWNGSSAEYLWDMIKDINEPITFWLDAHVFPPIDNYKNCPLMEELEQIKWHPIKNHIILIDDMSCAGTHSFDFITKEDLINKILEINPNYRISYIDGGDAGEAKDNIMVAIVP